MFISNRNAMTATPVTPTLPPFPWTEHHIAPKPSESQILAIINRLVNRGILPDTGHTTNQNKMALLGGVPVQNNGTGGTGITTDNWAVQQSNRAAAQGILTTANGWGPNTWDMWSGTTNFILTGTQKFELLLRQIGGGGDECAGYLNGQINTAYRAILPTIH